MNKQTGAERPPERTTMETKISGASPVYTDMSAAQRAVSSFHGQVSGLIGDLEDSVVLLLADLEALRNEPFSGWEQRRLAIHISNVNQAISLLKETLPCKSR